MKSQQKVSVIIPAYNEEKDIGRVLETVTKGPLISEVIVVDDGSKDKTSNIAEKYKVKLIKHKKNLGKASAMKSGLDIASEELILFLDADLLGLTLKHIIDLVSPISSEKTNMTVGIFKNGRFSTNFSHAIYPNISGQRCAKKELWKKIFSSIKNVENLNFGIEVEITSYLKSKNIKFQHIPLYGISQVMKEEKLGLKRGVIFRVKMYWDISKNQVIRFFKWLGKKLKIIA